MEPSRVTLEEAQELFQICMPGIKKEKNRQQTVWGQILAEPSICGSNPAAVSKVSDGWICTEKPGRLRGRS